VSEIRYPVVPPYEPEQGEVLMERPGQSWHPTLFTWVPLGDPRLPFRFPGTPAQVYRQAMDQIVSESVMKATIGQWADYLWESDFGDPPEGWVEVRSGMPGVTRRFIPPVSVEHHE